MAKVSIGLTRHAGEVVLRDGVAHEWTHHLDRHFRVRPPGKARDHGRLEPRPSLRHIEAAIAGKAGQHRLAEAERRGFAPG